MNEKKINVGDFKLGKEEKKAINDILDCGKITEGKKVFEFERSLAEYVGTKYAVAVNSGTSALISAILSIKYMKKHINPKVITTPLTYTATSNSILLNNLEPKYVDVDPINFNITPENIKAHLEEINDPEEYSMILPVHLMGYGCEMDKINKIAKKYGLIVLEDAAESLGTTYKGSKTGSLGYAAAFSFYIAHNIQAGEMGAVTTDDIDLWKMIKKIKANGRMCDCPVCTRMTTGCPKSNTYIGDDDFDPRFTHEYIGYNFKTMEFPAALATIQLKKADDIVKKRQENVKYLNEGLEAFSDTLQLPSYSEEVSYLAYPIVVKQKADISRKQLRKKLEDMGVETRTLFGCIPAQQPAYEKYKSEYAGKLPNAENIGKNGFYIGCHQYLKQDDLDYIIKAFKDIFRKKI